MVNVILKIVNAECGKSAIFFVFILKKLVDEAGNIKEGFY